MEAHDLYVLFLQNGLQVNSSLSQILSDEEIEEYLKHEFVLLIDGTTARSYPPYKEFAEDVQKIYKQLVQ